MGNSKADGYRLLRRGRHSEPNRSYLVTTVTYGRVPHFAGFAAGCTMSRLISASTSWPGASVEAWVLMPDHLHVLLTLHADAALSALLNRFKGRSSFEFNRWRGERGQLWLEGFHDRALRAEEDLRTVARYLIANPLRGGLVQGVGEYPFWDCVWAGRDDVGV